MDALVRVFHKFNRIFRSYLLNGFVSIDGSKFLADNSKENNLSQLSLSDTDAKLMKTRNGFSVAHNVQTVVESDTHAIVICPAGRQLRQNQVTRQGFIRYINKMAQRMINSLEFENMINQIEAMAHFSIISIFFEPRSIQLEIYY